MTTQRDELARELFIADNFNQPREQSVVDWDWFVSTPRFAVRVEHYKNMAEGAIANGWAKVPDDSKLSRVEVIDDSGRAYVKYTKGDVRIARQDDDRTLKVFITPEPTA